MAKKNRVLKRKEIIALLLKLKKPLPDSQDTDALFTLLLEEEEEKKKPPPPPP
jgi:hypothetical protein